MDLRRLRHFVVAAEESNFRRAAMRLDTNQSIISPHVRDIEEELGADLFHREPGHGARLTEVGLARGVGRGPSLHQCEERFFFFDDICRELGRGAVADVPCCMDRASRDNFEVTIKLV
ncbi:regulatory helix-turn-helix protein, lysR family [Bradyrhizobium canariense]|uniref:Regulatory helix-turn-helix protein, lysR family n=1 Tax=Bradyrhizobium canariense TaxID=255045 RepID=A0A1H1PIM5_9BRAD|nr:regulatory helix-turn-helix protein, lysR family [Bradyrhizobium canariense]